ncbi:MAG: CPBP family glutamic-type intramembrane protease [Pseudomonadota bacterium]
MAAKSFAETNRQVWLVVSALALIGFMAGFIPYATSAFGPALGLAMTFGVYWFGFCLPLGFAFQGLDAARRNLRLTRQDRGWPLWLLGGQFVLIAGVALALMEHPAPLAAVALAFAFGAFNGFCEEFYWRGAFLEQGRDAPWFQALGLALFTGWHWPLYLAHGVTFEGGALGLIGGSAFLGAAWTFVAWRTGRIGLCVIAHCATNAITFIGFFTMNFFG